MKVMIAGKGLEATSAAAYWTAQGHDVSSLDTPAGYGEIPADYLAQLEAGDLVVRGASLLPWRLPITKPITSVVNEFFAHCPTPNTIGVTGTKGKGTVTMLIAAMLTAAGKTVHVGGNIGVSLLDLLPEIQPTDWVVVELSSYQLIDLAKAPHIAVHLMLAPEHLDVHRGLAEYVEAKAQIFAKQVPGDVAVYLPENEYSRAAAERSTGAKRPYWDPAGAHVTDGWVYYQDTKICATSEVPIPGEHNLQNVCAAITAVYDTIADPAPIAAAIKAFKGLPHRMEEIVTVQGVRYVDDSISTTPESAIAALRSYTAPKVIILGGSDKKSDFAALGRVVAEAATGVRHAIIMGDTTPQIEAALEAAGFTAVTCGYTKMSEAVPTAASLAQPGDVVLMSPACASFGLFKDYKDRGDQFQAAVKALPQ